MKSSILDAVPTFFGSSSKSKDASPRKTIDQRKSRIVHKEAIANTSMIHLPDAFHIQRTPLSDVDRRLTNSQIILSDPEIISTVRYIYPDWNEIDDCHIRRVARLHLSGIRAKRRRFEVARWPDDIFVLLLFPVWRKEPWSHQLLYGYKQARSGGELICDAHRRPPEDYHAVFDAAPRGNL